MPDQPPGLQHNIGLAQYSTLKIGGPAKYFLPVKDADHAAQAIVWANQQKISWRVLGAGANSLVSDRGYDGLIMIMQNDHMTWDDRRVVAGAGTTNGQLIAAAIQHGAGGLHWLIGVPGTVGGSIYGNAGGHGWGLGHQVEWVDVVTQAGQIQRFSQQQCHFAYRYSIFKEQQVAIMAAQLLLPASDPAAERKILAETTKMKNTNQPTTAQSAGCMFMNPTVEATKLPEELRPFVATDGTISAWRLITEVGLQGKQLGQMQISPQHANFMVNLGGGTADQVVQLLSLVKQQVRDKLGIQLREEVQYIGF